MIPSQAITSIRNNARKQMSEGHREISVGIVALLHLCELALEHPLVDKRSSGTDYDLAEIVRLKP